MSSPIDPDEPVSTDRLEFALNLRDAHHNGIWEEQKHFTWLISLVLSVELLALGSGRVDGHTRDLLVFVASIVGLAFTVIGVRIQRIEGEYFRRANELFVEEFNKVFADPPIAIRPPVDIPSKESFARRLARIVRGKRTGVRENFEVLFLVFGLVFVGLALEALLSQIL